MWGRGSCVVVNLVEVTVARKPLLDVGSLVVDLVLDVGSLDWWPALRSIIVAPHKASPPRTELGCLRESRSETTHQVDPPRDGQALLRCDGCELWWLQGSSDGVTRGDRFGPPPPPCGGCKVALMR